MLTVSGGGEQRIAMGLFAGNARVTMGLTTLSTTCEVADTTAP